MVIEFIFFVVGFILVTGLGLGFLRQHLDPFSGIEKWSLSFLAGFVVLISLVYVFSFLQIRWLAGIITLFIGVISFFKWRDFLSNPGLPKLAGIIILLGVVAQLSLVAPSGMSYSDGDRYYGANGHDGLWHVALINNAAEQFPVDNPVYSGEVLKNYHYLSDVFASEFVRWFGISGFNLYYRFLPLVFSVLVGVLTYALTIRLTNSQRAAYISLILVYFAGSLGYLMHWINPGVNWETAFWAMQSVSTFINLPLGLSFGMLLAILILIHQIQKQFDWQIFWLLAIMTGMLWGIKAYGGVLALMGVGVLGLYELVVKKSTRIILLALVSFLFAVFFTLPLSDLTKTSFIVEPGWFPKTLMQAPDKMDMVSWELKRQTYMVENNWIRITQLWVIAIAIFIVGNFGVRMIGFLEPIVSRTKSFSYKDKSTKILMWVISLSGIILPLLLLQAGIVWNAIQFMYYSLLIMCIFTGITLATLFEKRSSILLITGLIVVMLFSLPTSIDTLTAFASMNQNKNYELVSNEEIEALDFLKERDLNSSVVLSTFDANALIPAYTGHQVYYGDETQVVLLGLDHETREEYVQHIFCETVENEELEIFLQQHQIEYIYNKLDNECNSSHLDTIGFLDQVFTNDSVRIYRYEHFTKN